MKKLSIHKAKFQRGDLVHIAKDLGPTMKHFQSDLDAVVLYTYGERYGGRNYDDYSLLLLDPKLGPHGCSWYHESQLTLKRSNFMEELVDEFNNE